MALTGQLLEDSGAGWVRMQLDWNWLDADPELIRMYDDAVDMARASGARVLLIASQTPSWASGSTIAESPPLDPGTYGDWLRTMVAHFKGRVDAYEIWNEPDTPNFWPSGPDAADYVALLKAGHAAVKGVRSERRGRVRRARRRQPGVPGGGLRGRAGPRRAGST